MSGNVPINAAYDIFLSVSDTISIDCDSEDVIDLALSIYLFSVFFFINL